MRLVLCLSVHMSYYSTFSFNQEWKLDTLCDLYETLTITQAVIFCNTRRYLMSRPNALSCHSFHVIPSFLGPSFALLLLPLTIVLYPSRESVKHSNIYANRLIVNPIS